MKLKRDSERKARIEMVPLIDMIFLLLVFFIYAMLSMAVHRSLPVNLPQSATAQIDKNELLSITIREDGAVFVDKSAVPLERLTETLRERSALKKEPGVLLFADSSLPCQKLIKVLDRIKQAGIDRVSMQAEKEK